LGRKLREEVIQFAFLNIRCTKSSSATVTILRLVLHGSNSKNTKQILQRETCNTKTGIIQQCKSSIQMKSTLRRCSADSLVHRTPSLNLDSFMMYCGRPDNLPDASEALKCPQSIVGRTSCSFAPQRPLVHFSDNCSGSSWQERCTLCSLVESSL
jgi:hypothetical protein